MFCFFLFELISVNFQIIKMECQVEHFRHLFLFVFNQGSKGAKAARDICAVYGESAIAERLVCQVQKWKF